VQAKAVIQHIVDLTALTPIPFNTLENQQGKRNMG
jgi:hypothetical protein